jgi:hypothetical protein
LATIVGVHETNDGPVRLAVERAGWGWIASVRGYSVEWILRCRTKREALREANRAIKELFPGQHNGR